jgi:hypothetical protein
MNSECARVHEKDLIESCCDAVSMIYSNLEQLQQQEEPELTVLPDVMVKYMQTPGVVTAACRALKQSTRICKENGQILGKGATRTVLLALSMHQNNEKLQTDGITALACMIHDTASNAECLFEADTLRTILRNLQLHMRVRNLQYSACYMFSVLSRQGPCLAGSRMRLIPREGDQCACA